VALPPPSKLSLPFSIASEGKWCYHRCHRDCDYCAHGTSFSGYLTVTRIRFGTPKKVNNDNGFSDVKFLISKNANIDGVIWNHEILEKHEKFSREEREGCLTAKDRKDRERAAPACPPLIHLSVNPKSARSAIRIWHSWHSRRSRRSCSLV
jgi:hypothetical protein